MKIEFTVPDMTCRHCVQAITKAVHGVDGQADVRITLEDHRVAVDTSSAGRDAIRAAIVDAGYTVDAA